MTARTPPARGRRRTGIPTAVLALVLAELLLLHGLVPNLGGYATLAEAFLPWLGLPILALAVLVALRFTRLGALGVVLAALVWGILFVPAALPSGSDDAALFTVASENVRAGNTAAAAIASDLAGRDPDVVALQELDDESLVAVSRELKAAYPYKSVVGTVGLWSKSPILDSSRLRLRLGWARALWADVDTGAGRTRVYVVHLDSIRPGQVSQRDRMLEALREALARDVSERIVVVGDFNSATTDRAFARLTGVVTDVGTSGFGLGFTWPSTFPLTRLDHVLVRGLAPVSSRVLPANGSDHRGILVALR